MKRPTIKELSLVLLRAIGPNPMEFMALGVEAFRNLAKRIDAMYVNDPEEGNHVSDE